MLRSLQLRPHDTTTAPPPVDQELRAILEAPLPPGMNAATGYQLKEEAIGAVLSTLSVDASKQLYARLATPAADDQLASAFGARLVGERRYRILNFLAGARRRAALRVA